MNATAIAAAVQDPPRRRRIDALPSRPTKERQDPACVNLLERFGSRYRIAFDPAYDPAHRPKDCLDPWMMVIPCERGEIFPYGGERLAAEVDGRPITKQRLRALPCVEVIQDGDDFVAVTFDAKDMSKIAQVLKPRRKRQVSEAERSRLAAIGRQHHFQKERTRLPDAPRASL